jgi:DNA polymerase-3 subunit delta'
MKIRGHTFVWTALTTLSREGRLPHALLFSGPEGIGKKQLARLFAQYLLCENPKSSQEACSSCHHCQLFLKGSYPDFYSLDAAAKETSPEQLRELLSRLELHAFEGGLRIILLDNLEPP